MEPAATGPVPVVETTAGRVVGIESEGVLLYAGIPYAAPPVGERRFAPPVAHPGWTGVRDATQFGPMPIQPNDQTCFPGGGVPGQAEDCLYLNVQTPAVTGEPRPVLVVFHGGGFQHGAGSMSTMNGGRFAQHGDLVVVTVNYRLGVWGWLYLAHLDERFADAANAGLLDQLLALRWVRDNIRAFGGDPGRVTLLGQSSGAMSATTLMALPAAAGLFHRVIAQSGTPRFTIERPHATEVAGRVLAALGLTSPHELLDVEAERLLEAQVQASREVGLARALRAHPNFFLAFGPVIDQRTLTTNPGGPIAEGAGRDIPLLVGANHDEWNWFATLAPPEQDPAAVIERLGHLGAPDPKGLLAFYLDLTDGDLGAAWTAMQTDRIFRVPAARLAETHGAHQPHTYQYLFSWRSPDPRIGACHSLEVPFVFDNLPQLDMAFYTGAAPPQALADAIHRAWIAFARVGAPRHEGLPAWPAYGPERATMVLGDDLELVDDPEPERRRVWDGMP